MPLATCHECAGRVSTEAAYCPHCGAPVRGEPVRRVKTTEDSFLTRSRGCGDIIIFGPILLIVLVVVFGSCP